MSLVKYRKQGAIAQVRLNRPEKLNAINAAMLEGLVAALERAERDDDVRAIVLSGEGRAFSAGFDLVTVPPPAGSDPDAHLRAGLRRDFDAIMRFWDCEKPVIAAVHGYCLGSSLEISAVCDLTIAAEGCRFGEPEVRFGSGILCLVLPWIVGLKHARELLLVGSNEIDARRAAEIGLVNHVVPEDELMSFATGMAERIAQNDALAVRLTRQALRRSMEIAGMRRALEAAFEIDIEIETGGSPETREFNRIAAAEGPRAALAWRRSQADPDAS